MEQPKVLVLGGTADGRQAAIRLLDAGQPVIYSSLSGINAPDAHMYPALTNHNGAMDETELSAYMANQGVGICVDATHPYARQASANAIAACATAGVIYLRLERPGLEKSREDVHFFDSYDDMIAYLADRPGMVLSTTGSRELEHYSALPKERLKLRVLPTSGVIKKCEDLGYKPANIIAMQGPFTTGMNVAILRQFDIRYLVTKDSGELGGVAQKVDAALECGAEVLCIRRPGLDYPVVCETPQAVVDWIAGSRVLSNEEE